MKLIHSRFILIPSLITILFFGACNSSSSPEYAESNSDAHEVVVKEVMQVSEYTYLRVTENNTEQWLAVPKTEAKVGETYYFQKGMVMNDFPSKELGRTFESIVFVDALYNDPVAMRNAGNTPNEMGGMQSGAMSPDPHGQATTGAMPKPVIEKVEVDVQPASGGITIAQLYEKKDSYANKTVVVRGQVTKVNNGIMGRNWVHLQDGTQFKDYMDLTVTTSETFTVGLQVTFEGKIALNKDFGYGYSYELLMEEGVAK